MRGYTEVLELNNWTLMPDAHSHMHGFGSNADVLQLGRNLHVQCIHVLAAKVVARALAQELVNLGQLFEQLGLLCLSPCLDVLQEVWEEAGISDDSTNDSVKHTWNYLYPSPLLTNSWHACRTLPKTQRGLFSDL